MLVLVTAIALATQVPLAITLESDLHASTTGLGPSIYTVGLPDELAKAIPVLAVALIYWRRRSLTPRDYLFLGAVSGLVFGASEVVHYFTVNGVEEFYLTIQSAIPPIEQLLATGHSASTSLFAVLIGPMRYFTLDFVWRFLTDPISHACWSGLTGYFIGLAVTRRHKWYAVAWIGLAAAAVLHGLNDWGRVNGPCGSWSPRSAASCSSASPRPDPGAPRNLPAMPCRRPSGCTGLRPGMRRPHRTGTRSRMRCPGAGHQGLGGNTRSPGTGRTAPSKYSCPMMSVLPSCPMMSVLLSWPMMSLPPCSGSSMGRGSPVIVTSLRQRSRLVLTICREAQPANSRATAHAPAQVAEWPPDVPAPALAGNPAWARVIRQAQCTEGSPRR
jgi:PrsW family intramembrane metalloprotease